MEEKEQQRQMRQTCVNTVERQERHIRQTDRTNVRKDSRFSIWTYVHLYLKEFDILRKIMYYVKYDTNLTYILLLVRSRFYNIWQFQVMTFYHDNSFQKLAEVDKINFYLFIQHRVFYMVWRTCIADMTVSNLNQGTGYSNEIFIWFCHFLHSNLEIVCWLVHDYHLLNHHHSVLHGLSCWLGHKVNTKKPTLLNFLPGVSCSLYGVQHLLNHVVPSHLAGLLFTF